MDNSTSLVGAVLDMTSADIWGFLSQEFPPPIPQDIVDTIEEMKSLELSSNQVKRLVEPLLLSLPDHKNDLRKYTAELLANKIRRIQQTFPFEYFSDDQLKEMVKALIESGQKVGEELKPGREGIAKLYEAKSVKILLENNRSHMIFHEKSERITWGANHNYGEYWKFFFCGGHVAIIDNPIGSLTPSRFIDHCTQERLKSYCKKTKYSPVKGWEEQLEKVCIKLLNKMIFELKSSFEQHIPLSPKKVGEADFRQACISRFPCSYHFPPTSLHATLSFLFNMNKNLFEKGCRMLDPCAGHGHRLAAALSCPKITFMAATDPNKEMMAGYQKIYEVVEKHFGINGPLYIQTEKTQKIGVDGTRYFHIIEGKAEDPKNPIYRKDFYQLVFSSPPFFDTEIYGDDEEKEGQSTQSFQEFEDWIKGFLEPMVKNCWDSLCPGGYLAFNLTDSYKYKLVEALIKIVKSDSIKGKYMGMIPSRKAEGNSRWNKKEENQSKIDQGIDPIWIFQKESVKG